MMQYQKGTTTKASKSASRKVKLLRYSRRVQQVLSAIPGDIAAKILSLYKEGNHESILGLSVSPDDYSDPWSFRQDYLAVRFLQKCPYLRTGIDTRAVAAQKFWDAESECRRTNVRIRGTYRVERGEAVFPLRVKQLHAAREKIRSILGRFDSTEWFSMMRFGPGATLSTKGDWTSNYRKLQSSPDCTATFYPLARYILSSSRLWTLSCSREEPSIVAGNKVDFVPKNAKTDRPIAVEPILNGYAQLGLGGMIRRRLRSVGIDLNDQLLNQAAAYLGSLRYEDTTNWKTLDLASASDTIALELVRELLPSDWLHAMELCRSSSFTLDGELHTYEKFSSMGNGYTFELESLIFCSLIWAVGIADSDRCVYGDDLAVDAPLEKVEDLIDLLSFCGFSLNREKTFLTGPFRESCGKDFFKGALCTPLYAREGLGGKSYFLHNQLLRWDQGFGPGLFSSVCENLIEETDPLERYFIPDGFGDGGFVILDLQDVLRRSAESPKGILPRRCKGQVEGWITRHLVEQPIRRAMSRYHAAIGAMLLSVSGASYPDASSKDWHLRELTPTFGFETARRRTSTKVGKLFFR